MKNHIVVFGEYSCMSESRKKFTNPPCVVGDIVTLIKQYRNGKPVPKEKMELDSMQIGYVCACEFHTQYKEDCITVRWNDANYDSMYIQKTSGCFLYKLN